jgi:hypothetical protein
LKSSSYAGIYALLFPASRLAFASQKGFPFVEGLLVPTAVGELAADLVPVRPRGIGKATDIPARHFYDGWPSWRAQL